MSIRNFPKIPKIILRKSADQAKGEKNPLCKLAILICRNFEVFDVLLLGATLNPKHAWPIALKLWRGVGSLSQLTGEDL